MPLSHLSRRSLLLVLPSIAFLADIVRAQWGADVLSESYRPDVSWTSKFSDTPDIIADGSIESAIEKCDSVVGLSRYCVIGVGANSSSQPFGIYRSRTRVVGLDNAVSIKAQRNTASVYIPSGLRFVSVENLTFAGIDAGDSWTAAIEVSGSNIENVEIKNNVIHSFSSTSAANGIIVYGKGNSKEQSVSHIIIDGNVIRDMRTGSSETVAISGNVEHWVVSNNRIERINNIAIDAIGGEGLVAPMADASGRVLPSAIDAARIGWIENNTISDMSTADNPAYGNTHTWAAAIYIDGARRVKITGNAVFNAPWAYEIGAENCVISSDITMLGNTAFGSYYGDLRIGGYAKGGYESKDSTVNCNPLTSEDSLEGHGYVREITVKNNILGSVAPRVDNIFIEYRTEGAVVIQEGVVPVRENGNGRAPGDGNAIRVVEDPQIGRAHV